MSTLELAKQFLGQTVQVVMDRPFGSSHPRHGFPYSVNYGYIPDTLAADGEELDAYFLGVDIPLETAEGICIAILHRLDDDDDKLIVVPPNTTLTDAEIRESTAFVESYFTSEIIRPTQ
jgi:inorganic pyrophosphatase